MGEDSTRGHNADMTGNVPGGSGWVTTQQAARALGISPRTVRWHIEHGNLVAESRGEGVQRTWLVSIDSLQAFRDARQRAGELPGGIRANERSVDIAADIPGNPIRELADRLAEEAAKAAEYRVRLELTERAQSTLEGELREERQRRKEAERERDELKQRLESPPEPRDEPETPREDAGGVEDRGEPAEPQTGAEDLSLVGDKSNEASDQLVTEETARRPWWIRWFGG